MSQAFYAESYPYSTCVVGLGSGLGSLQKLAVDFTRASESLKTWGMGEGEDLGVCLQLA
jgi:hypothetical protein